MGQTIHIFLGTFTHYCSFILYIWRSLYIIVTKEEFVLINCLIRSTFPISHKASLRPATGGCKEGRESETSSTCIHIDKWKIDGRTDLGWTCPSSPLHNYSTEKVKKTGRGFGAKQSGHWHSSTNQSRFVVHRVWFIRGSMSPRLPSECSVIDFMKGWF